MPFDMVFIVLGASFVSAWVFIGGMLMRDSLDHAKHVRFDPASSLPRKVTSPEANRSGDKL